jgi:hypothetical protein
MICKKCVLPESKPDILLNADGICNVCLSFKKVGAFGSDKKLLETDLIKILNKYKGKYKYDCLVMCSGGKDSTLSLYYMRKRYKVNPLAFTFDHGFEDEDALENIRNAVEILGVDWIYYKSDFMKDVFIQIIRSQTMAPICHVCAIWYIGLTCDLASRYGISLIVAGWTKGQSLQQGELGIEYKSMSKATADFIEGYLRKDSRYKDFPRSIREVLEKSCRKFKSYLISPHWFLQYDSDKIKEILQTELKWKAPKLSYPADSTNCLMNFANVYLSMKNYGYTHYHIEMSKLIRLGELSRQEALRRLEINFDDEFVNGILSKIGCQLDY